MPAHQLPSTPQATLGEPVESPHKLYRLTTTAVDAAGLSTCRVGSIPPQGFVRVSVSVNSEVLVDARFAAPIAVDSRHRFYEATFRLTRSRGCDTGSFLSPSLNRIDVGQRVTLQAFVPLSCAGTVRVIVRYVPDFRTALTTAVLPPGTRVLGRSSVTIR
jgi:hypothetical protein